MNLSHLKTGFIVYHQRTGERLVFSRWYAGAQTAEKRPMAICIRPGVSGNRKFVYVPGKLLEPKPLARPPEPRVCVW